MSASAPLGRPSRNTGSVGVCTSATITGEVVSEVISQAAATSFIDMQLGGEPHHPERAEHRIGQRRERRGRQRGPSASCLGGESDKRGSSRIARPVRCPLAQPALSLRRVAVTRATVADRPPRREQRRAVGLRRQRVAEATVDPVEGSDAAVAVEPERRVARLRAGVAT